MSDDGTSDKNGDASPPPEPVAPPKSGQTLGEGHIEPETAAELARIRGELEQLSVAVATLQETTDAHRGTSDLVERLDDLESQLDDIEPPRNDLEARLNDIEARLETLDAQSPSTDDSTTNPAELRARFDDLESRLEDHIRRSEREREQIAAQSVSDLAERMLSVKDSLDNVLGMDDLDGDARRQIELLEKQFEKELTAGEIRRIDTDGRFDDSRHKMVDQVADDDLVEGTIIRELDAGYAVGDRVVRPARVVVATSEE